MRTTRLVAAAAITGGLLILPSCGFAGTWPASQITDHGALLRGNIGSSEGGVTEFHFEYGTTDAYGSSTPTGSAEVTDVHEPVALTELVEGLAEGTTYHYRLCASDAGGGDCSADATFTTTTGHDYVLGLGYVSASTFGPHGGQVNVSAAHDGSAPRGTVRGYEANTSPWHFDYSSFGEISCLRVEGNRASIGGLVHYAGFGFPPQAVVIYIEDGATTGTPDRWATKWVGSDVAPTTCPAPNEADFPALVLLPASPPFPPGGVTIPRELDNGDFVVHDHP